MEIVAVLIISLAFLIVAFNAENVFLRFFYFMFSLTFVMLGTYLMFNELSFLSNIYYIGLWIFVIFIIIFFVYIMKDTFKLIMQIIKQKAIKWY